MMRLRRASSDRRAVPACLGRDGLRRVRVGVVDGDDDLGLQVDLGRERHGRQSREMPGRH